MSNYTPKFTDPRVLATTKRALSFVALYTKASSKSWISRNELYKHFGNTSRPLGKFLKEHLLIEADSYYNAQTGTCKKYIKNTKGIELVERLAGINTEVELSPELEEQLATGDFVYDDKSQRLYNPLQFIPKQVRGSILSNHGYKYHYDIEAAAPTLLIQKALKINPNLKLDSLKYYTENRTEIRKLIAEDCNLSDSQIKTVINGLIQGGVLSCWQQGKIYRELNYSYHAIFTLRANPLLKSIRDDITLMWKTLKSEFPQRYLTDKNGKLRSQRLSAKDKSGLYRDLESEVGGVIRKLLKKRKIQSLWIHDGWCCNGFIDPLDVELEVKRTTGYSVKLEWNKYEDM